MVCNDCTDDPYDLWTECLGYDNAGNMSSRLHMVGIPYKVLNVFHLYTAPLSVPCCMFRRYTLGLVFSIYIYHILLQRAQLLELTDQTINIFYLAAALSGRWLCGIELVVCFSNSKAEERILPVTFNTLSLVSLVKP